MNARFRVKTTVYNKEPQWIACIALNDEAKNLISGKLAAIRPFTDRFSENIMKRTTQMLINEI